MAEAGEVLMVFFLCVMNITLLNLLIAILATAHARLEGNADKEAVLSEAVIITQYRYGLSVLVDCRRYHESGCRRRKSSSALVSGKIMP